MRQNLLLALLSLVWILSGTAKAQSEHKNEIGLLLGSTLTPTLNAPGAGGGKLEIGSGIAFQLTYARKVAALRPVAFYLEVPTLAIPRQDIKTSNSIVPRFYDSFFLTPALRLKFVPDSNLSPWFSAGGGYALFDESSTRMDGSHNIPRGTNGGAAQFGGGLDIRTPIKVLFPIGLRLEARDFYTQKPKYNVNAGGGFQHNVALSGGLILYF